MQQTVKVSPKFQVVIPKEIREKMAITPGEKFQIFSFNERIELVPIRKMKDMRGFLKGMNSSIRREKDRL